MAKRTRVYYAKWQMTNGLLASNREWMYRNTKEEYVGPYHKYVDGAVMTGGSYNESTSEFIVPFVDLSKNAAGGIYDEIRTGEDIKKYTPPKVYNPRNHLTLLDYKRTWFSRYFVKRRNNANSDIIEINANQYKTLTKKGAGINGNLYYGITLRWRIAGNVDNEFVDGVTHFGITEANKRTLFYLEKQMPGIIKFLGFLEEFSIYSKLTNETIKQELL